MSHDFPPPPPPSPEFSSGDDNPNDRNLAVLAHAGTLVNLITGGLGFIVPLVLMLTKGKDSPLIRRNAVASLNFQISIIIYAVISAILILVLIGFVLIFVVAVFSIVAPIIASIRTSEGKEYKYPLSLTLVR